MVVSPFGLFAAAVAAAESGGGGSSGGAPPVSAPSAAPGEPEAEAELSAAETVLRAPSLPRTLELCVIVPHEVVVAVAAAAGAELSSKRCSGSYLGCSDDAVECHWPEARSNACRHALGAPFVSAHALALSSADAAALLAAQIVLVDRVLARYVWFFLS